MRIISGTARGIKLDTLQGNSTRPTIDRVKEAIYSSIHFLVEGSSVLDLFAGSGQMGVEALSRGANYSVFIDENVDATKIIKDNLLKTKLNSKATVYHTSAEQFLLSNKKTFDIVFLDPPYAKGTLEKILPLVEKAVNNKGIVICESEVDLVLPENVGDLIKSKTYKYGKVLVTKYIKE